MPEEQISSRHRFAFLALGMSVLLAACQREDDNADVQANIAAGEWVPSKEDRSALNKLR